MNVKSFILGKANGLVKRTFWYNQVVFPGCRKFWEIKTFNLDVINLGSTASYCAFDYSTVNHLKCANFALPSQYLLADYEILLNYCSYYYNYYY